MFESKSVFQDYLCWSILNIKGPKLCPLQSYFGMLESFVLIAFIEVQKVQTLPRIFELSRMMLSTIIIACCENGKVHFPIVAAISVTTVDGKHANSAKFNHSSS